MFARIRKRPDALVVCRPDIGEKKALMAAEPEKYFQTPHYADHPAVLVRLEQIDVTELEELLTGSWLLSAPVRLAEKFEAERGGEAAG